MGQALAIQTFTVVKSNPSGNLVRFTVTDTHNILTMTHQIRAVIFDAIEQFIAAETADLITNGDGAIQTNFEKAVSDKVRTITQLTWSIENKYATLALTALTNIAATGNITATAPFHSEKA